MIVNPGKPSELCKYLQRSPMELRAIAAFEAIRQYLK